MGRKKAGLPDARVEPLRSQIEHWRQTRAKRSPMPEPLWGAAAKLAREHGVYAAAQALRLSYDSLRKRAEAAGASRRVRGSARRQRSATFVQLPPALMATAADPSGPIVEVVGPSGQRLTVRLRGDELDVAELIRACWSGRA